MKSIIWKLKIYITVWWVFKNWIFLICSWRCVMLFWLGCWLITVRKCVYASELVLYRLQFIHYVMKRQAGCKLKSNQTEQSLMASRIICEPGCLLWLTSDQCFVFPKQSGECQWLVKAPQELTLPLQRKFMTINIIVFLQCKQTH